MGHDRGAGFPHLLTAIALFAVAAPVLVHEKGRPERVPVE